MAQQRTTKKPIANANSEKAFFDPAETPTGKYKPGKIRDRNLNNILDAAEEEFVQNGYRGTSIQNIANRAGIPKANVHYYFRSKQNLYMAVLDNIISLWNDLLGDISQDDDPAEILDAFIRRKVHFSYMNARSSKLYAMEMIMGAPNLHDYIRVQMRQWVKRKAQVIDQWISQGRMAKVDSTQLIFLIWSATQHYADFDIKILTIMNRAEYEPEMMEQIANFLSEIILRGCGLTLPLRRDVPIAQLFSPPVADAVTD